MLINIITKRAGAVDFKRNIRIKTYVVVATIDDWLVHVKENVRFERNYSLEKLTVRFTVTCTTRLMVRGFPAGAIADKTAEESTGCWKLYLVERGAGEKRKETSFERVRKPMKTLERPRNGVIYEKTRRRRR